MLTLADLAAFVKNPVQAWCRHRLQVQFPRHDAAAEDDEPFGDDTLERWVLGDEVLRAAQATEVPEAHETHEAHEVTTTLAATLARLARSGWARPCRGAETTGDDWRV